MNVRRTASIVLGLALAFAPAQAQIPDKFTNLKVLPKDVSKAELIRTMRGWTGALGVRCGHCHTGGNPDTLEGVDFASDAKWEKRTARAMVRMVAAVNSDHLDKLEAEPAPEGGPAPAPVRVECVTCHRGISRPETIDAILARVLAKEGAEAALRTYKDLRSRYLASGSYDFSQMPLNALVERLIDEGRAADALPLMEVNAENYPNAPWTLFLLGEARLAAGDRAGALQAFERSLELAPKNARAQKRVEELKTPPPKSPEDKPAAL
jgi:tetratricopeptide (TPR) repeat protein